MFVSMIKVSGVHLNVCSRCNKQSTFSGQKDIERIQVLILYAKSRGHYINITFPARVIVENIIRGM